MCNPTTTRVLLLWRAAVAALANAQEDLEALADAAADLPGDARLTRDTGLSNREVHRLVSALAWQARTAHDLLDCDAPAAVHQAAAVAA